jgi:peptide/nickel transport system ATP-binding protein
MTASSEPDLLDVRGLVQEFRPPRLLPFARPRVLHAVSDVSFTLRTGECLGLVGETGCGKSTLARAIMQAPPPVRGQVRFLGQELVGASRSALRQSRRGMQYVFQDPFASLDPTWKVRDLVAEPMRTAGGIGRARVNARVDEMLHLVGLPADRYAFRRPRELSGGQCQRVAVARALTLAPKLLICDEVVSGLDVSVQAQILNLLETLRRDLGLAYLFISHDLGVVRHLCDRVAVMYLGKIVETGPAEQVYARPRHPYTAALLAAVPRIGEGTSHDRPQWARLGGELPSPLAPPSGCRFRTRCPRAADRCATEEPPMVSDDVGHAAACHFPAGEPASGAAPARPRAGGGVRARPDSAAAVPAGPPASVSAATRRPPP